MDSKDEIKQKVDIVELVGEYIQLKAAGNAGMKGLCPFHGEKTPSFHVSRDRQIWHCFGCGEGGDCFSFVMRMEGMTFPEALLHLGKRVGVEVRHMPTVEGNVKSRMSGVNDLASRYFHKVLLDSSKAASARAYVDLRGITGELVEMFALGYAPDEWDALSGFLLKRGFSESELTQAGVSLKKKSGSGVIDRFRNRLMVPLRDHHGNVVGFTGRSMPGDDDGPKYMNSPETPIYHKGGLVYGLDLAKTAIREKGFVVVVEGNLDVVASHKGSVKNVVASSGTAFTQDQLTLLKRYTETIVFCFDSDAAGFAAAKKGISLARASGFDVRAAILSEGFKDPDELVQKDPNAWQECVRSSVPIMQFMIAHVTRGRDFRNIDDKRAVSKELLPELSLMSSVVEREHWTQVVADLLSIPADQLRASIKTSTPSSLTPHPSPLTPSHSPLTPPLAPRSTKDEQARQLLFGIATQSEARFDKLRAQLETVLMGHPLWITLYKMANDAYDPGSLPTQKSFFSRIRSLTSGHTDQAALEALLDTSSFLADETFQDIPENQLLEQIDHLFSMLSALNTSRDRSALARALRQAEQAGDDETVRRLLSTLD
jgi:DNA primase